MHRRIKDYPDAYAGLNLVSTYGSYISFASTLIFFFAIVYALFFGKKEVSNPWGEGADTLEWTLSSPPPFHQFETLPKFKE